jgi:soluble lytic murein transglycosylase
MPEALLEAAEQALFNGDWDRALEEYQVALEQAVDPADQTAAYMGLGATLLQEGRYPEAVEKFDASLADDADSEQQAQAYFLRAQAKEALDLHTEAAQDYEAYLRLRPNLIDAYVHARRGEAFYAAGDYPAAIEAYQAALEAPQLDEGLAYKLDLARALSASGDHAGALAKYEEVYQASSDEEQQALVDYLMGQAYTKLGQTEQAFERYLDAVEKFPRSYNTYLGLVELVENGVAVDELARGIVDYYAEQYAVALAAFERYLYAVPEDHDGRVHYYKGLTLRAMGEYESAIEAWEELIDEHPDDVLWDEGWEQKAYTQWAYLDEYSLAAETLLDFVAAAPDHLRAGEFLFDAARVMERDEDLEAAAEVWERVATEYPDGEWAYQALFLAGISHFRLGHGQEAADIFQRVLEFAADSYDRSAAYLWIGKSHQILGDAEAAEAAWSVALQADPFGYYSLRAEDLLAGREPFKTVGVADFTTDVEEERRKAEEWMRATFTITGPEPLTELDPELAADPRMIRGQELWRLGLYGQAKAEFEALRFSIEDDAEATYRLMHKLLDLGLYQPAIYASKHILDLAGMQESQTWHAPAYFNHIRFGPYFGELILPEALEQGFDGLFLLSVARQESLFEGFATSYAAARGLMQIIPSTGQEIADKLGWPPDYDQDDLYRPLVSVRLGAHYLAEQRDRFNGDLYATLAAYNAGPGNGLAWKALAPDDPDLFLEIVRLGQPQTYIRVIYWAYRHYCDLYVTP